MTIAEESTAFPGFLSHLPRWPGFGFKWNMGWMHDTLSYMQKEPIHRRYHHNDMTFSMVYHYDENFILSLSHDEGWSTASTPCSTRCRGRWQQAANLRAYMGFMYAHPGKKLTSWAPRSPRATGWNHDAQLPWHLLQYPRHGGQQRLIRDLNHLYRHEPALYQADYEQAGFRWLDHQDADNSIFTPGCGRTSWGPSAGGGLQLHPGASRVGYRLGVPAAGHYRVVLNTDSEHYWGSNRDGFIPRRRADPLAGWRTAWCWTCRRSRPCSSNRSPGCLKWKQVDHPLGARPTETGCHFCVWAPQSDKVELCLFDEEEQELARSPCPVGGPVLVRPRALVRPVSAMATGSMAVP